MDDISRAVCWVAWIEDKRRPERVVRRSKRSDSPVERSRISKMATCEIGTQRQREIKMVWAICRERTNCQMVKLVEVVDVEFNDGVDRKIEGRIVMEY